MTLKLNGTNSVAAPAYAGDDADTGLQCGTNELKLVTGGTARVTVDSSGNVDIAGGLEVTESGLDKALRLRYPRDSSNAARTTFEVTASVAGSETAVASIRGDGSASFGDGSPFADAQLTVSNGGSGNSTIGWRRTGSGENDWAISNQGGELKVLGGGDATTVSGLSEKVRFQSAGGISFNGDTAAVNALDDYEEGTWNITNGGDSTGVISTSHCKYTKIGRVVVCHFVIKVSANFTSSTLGGLPFPPGNVSGAPSAVHGLIVVRSAGSGSFFFQINFKLNDVTN